MNSAHFDLLVIGAGAAGSTAATTAAKMGAHVGLIERDKLGGTCLNYGCDPTKTLLHIASELYHARIVRKDGIHISEARVDWPETQRYIQEVLRQVRGGSPEEAASEIEKQGITFLHGEATFQSAHEVKVNKETYWAKQILIATGCQAFVPPIEGLESAGYLTNAEAIFLEKLPRSLGIVGGGAIGLEFAQMFQRFGVSVTVLEHAPVLLDNEDHELADRLCQLLEQEGIRMETGAELKRVEKSAEGKRLIYSTKDHGEQSVEVDEILLALGRRPALKQLHLERAGVKTEERGITVDKMLRTSVPHIWAAGDVTGGYQFTHVAYEQGKLAAQNAFTAEPRIFVDHVIPWVIYTEPALAHVGKTEEQLKDEKVFYKVGRKEFQEHERAISNGQTEGAVKLLVDKRGHLLGAHILGFQADDLLAPVIVAMNASLPVSVLANSILPYPTLSEAVRWAADSINLSEEKD